MFYKKQIGIVAALMLGMASWAFAQNNTGKTGYLTLTAPAQVGNVTLPAGNYEVKHRFSSAGHYTEFARITEWTSGNFEGMSTFEEREVVAKVNCTMQPLTGKANKTTVEEDGSRIARLEIKGENVVHNF
jgi:hypothetical protein